MFHGFNSWISATSWADAVWSAACVCYLVGKQTQWIYSSTCCLLKIAYIRVSFIHIIHCIRRHSLPLLSLIIYCTKCLKSIKISTSLHLCGICKKHKKYLFFSPFTRTFIHVNKSNCRLVFTENRFHYCNRLIIIHQV